MSPRSGSKPRAVSRRWLMAAAGGVAGLLLAACGSATGSGHAGSGGATGGTSVTAWIVTTGPSPANTVINQAVAAFEKSHPGDHITVSYVENQSYKQKRCWSMAAASGRCSGA
jgi:ABC-type glycerol-3-phosphate transport system substrate-binding protein